MHEGIGYGRKPYARHHETSIACANGAEQVIIQVLHIPVDTHIRIGLLWSGSPGGANLQLQFKRNHNTPIGMGGPHAWYRLSTSPKTDIVAAMNREKFEIPTNGGDTTFWIDYELPAGCYQIDIVQNSGGPLNVSWYMELFARDIYTAGISESILRRAVYDVPLTDYSSPDSVWSAVSLPLTMTSGTWYTIAEYTASQGAVTEMSFRSDDVTCGFAWRVLSEAGYGASPAEWVPLQSGRGGEGAYGVIALTSGEDGDPKNVPTTGYGTCRFVFVDNPGKVRVQLMPLKIYHGVDTVDLTQVGIRRFATAAPITDAFAPIGGSW